MTGDLRIIKDNALRKLLTEEATFRESKPINCNKARSRILTGLEECTQKWCDKNGVNKNFFSEWINEITSLLK